MEALNSGGGGSSNIHVHTVKAQQAGPAHRQTGEQEEDSPGHRGVKSRS